MNMLIHSVQLGCVSVPLPTTQIKSELMLDLSSENWVVVTATFCRGENLKNSLPSIKINRKYSCVGGKQMTLMLTVT